MRAVGPGGVSQSTHLKGKHVCVPTSDPVKRKPRTFHMVLPPV